jgi:hypothetical protein
MPQLLKTLGGGSSTPNHKDTSPPQVVAGQTQALQSSYSENYHFKSQRRDNNVLNFLTNTIELKLAIVVPTAINARLSSASCKPQVIIKKPDNTKIATKTQVSKGIPTYFLVVCAYKLSHKKPRFDNCSTNLRYDIAHAVLYFC